MKLFRYKENNLTKPGILINDKMFDASGFANDYNEDLKKSQMRGIKI